jgi:hypothetical protein
VLCGLGRRLLVEEAGRRGSLGYWSIVPDRGVDDDGLHDELSLGDIVALGQGHSGDEGAEEGGDEDVGGLHVVGVGLTFPGVLR